MVVCQGDPEGGFYSRMCELHGLHDLHGLHILLVLHVLHGLLELHDNRGLHAGLRERGSEKTNGLQQARCRRRYKHLLHLQR